MGTYLSILNILQLPNGKLLSLFSLSTLNVKIIATNTW